VPQDKNKMNNKQKIQMLKELSDKGLLEWEITPRKFKHKITGEIVTQIPIFEMRDYEEIE